MNAKEVAIERGMAVRDELVRLGVDPQIIRIGYSIEIPAKHAAEIELHKGNCMPASFNHKQLKS